MTEDEEFELELEIAKAKVKSEKEARKASWRDVITQNLLKGAAGAADTFINFPENAYNLGKMAYGMGTIAGGHPELAPDVQAPNDLVTSTLDKNKLIRNIGETTPEQDIAATAAQGAGGALVGGGISGGVKQSAANLATAALGAGTGKYVEQETGSPAAGMAASVLSPQLGARLPNPIRNKTIINNQVRDKILEDANSVGYTTVPTGRIAEFANRPKMLETAIERNQLVTNKIARDTLGFGDRPLEVKELDKFRNEQYTNGYKPVEQVGTVITTNDYLNDLTDIIDKYSSPSFPDALLPEVDTMVNSYLQGTITAKDTLEQIKNLRNRASRNIASNDAVKSELGFAQKDVANALERELERQAMTKGFPPEIMQGYKDARRNIAISHTVQEALDGTGNVQAASLARNFSKGDYMDGQLAIAARFGQYAKTKPKNLTAKDDSNQLFTFGHAAGLAAGGAAAQKMGLDPATGAYMAALGAGVYHKGKDILGVPFRSYMGTSAGQQMPDYTNIGINPNMMAPSGLGFFNSMEQQEE